MNNHVAKTEPKRSSIRTKLQLIIAILVVISSILISIAAVKSIHENYVAINKSLETALIDRYEDSTKFQIETVESIIQAYFNQTGLQNVPQDVRDGRIKNFVRNAKYDNGIGYFFLYDMNGNVIAHGNDPTLEGKNLLHITDPTGLPVIEKLRDAALKGGGYVTYLWNKPNDLVNRYKKISYADKVADTPWWIGTGIYMDEVEKIIKQVKHQQDASVHKLFIQFLILTFALLAISLVISLYFAARISKPIITLSRIAKKIAGGNYKIRADFESDDEIGDMASSFNDMADSINEKIEDLIFKEHYTSNLLESIADGLVVTDANNKIVQVNPAAEKIFGFTREELLNEDANILIPEEHRETYKKNVLDQVLEGKVFYNFNVKRFKKDGSEIYLIVTIAPVIEENKKIQLRIHSIKDVTEPTKLRAQLKQMENLKKYFPTQVVEKIIEGDGKVNLDYHRQKVTIFFSDLVGFTELSDSMEPEEVVSLLSEYLTNMSKIIYSYSGTFDKFIGDALMVFFGAPATEGAEKDAINCLNMAIDMQEKLLELNTKWNLPQPLKMRIGINTGFATVGNFGSDIRLEYTIVGTPVNLASRLEEACPPSSILISHETAQLVKNHFTLKPIEPIQVKGIHRLVNVYEVVGRKI